MYPRPEGAEEVGECLPHPPPLGIPADPVKSHLAGWDGILRLWVSQVVGADAGSGAELRSFHAGSPAGDRGSLQGGAGHWEHPERFKSCSSPRRHTDPGH